MDGSRLALWGGVEASVVRIGDVHVDQVRRTGHHDRLDDAARIASLKIDSVRYPVVWERVAPNGLGEADWTWTDERLDALRRLGIVPIVTLLHHGSGPRYTSLLDPQFPSKLAAYARAVARRYPWLRYFTPVNEPLTTARFSALYGHWFPHLCEPAAFVTALLNQIEGIARAMNAIREEIPGAMLVQTEDLTKIHSTPELAYQAEFENARRWASIDLLCGNFDENFLTKAWLRTLGLELRSGDLARYRCEPHVLGFNYYVTSERFLDHRVDGYPGCVVGGNGRNRYVDIEAVRVRADGIEGGFGLLREAWERYRRPLAITEAQIACTPHEQVRWVEELYADAVRLRQAGADVRAFTLWALFGAWDWNSLLTRRDNCYEPGCFDVRHTPPRETILAAWVRAKASGTVLRDASLRGEGWWRLPSRVIGAVAS